MGKNRAAVGGLSRFLQAFENSKHPEATTSTTNTLTTVTEPAVTPTPEDVGEAAKPRKKRKTGLLGAGYERYDATELVQFYTHHSAVPDHLKKCKQLHVESSRSHAERIRFSPENALFFVIRFRLSPR